MPRIVCQRDGPCILQGIATLSREDDPTPTRVRDVALCRCGGSGRKPVCDATHVRIGFTAPAGVPYGSAGSMPEVADVRARFASLDRASAARSRPLVDVIAMNDGPYAVSDAIALAGVSMTGSGRYLLCRCGTSRRKPFCDGSHAN
jgi:CDGSH-type Zn-finger protein